MQISSNKKVRPRKSLGQNFLTNQNVQRRIVESCQLKTSDIVIEIGPGKGALTQHLADRVTELIVIEKDRCLADHLRASLIKEKIKIIEGDILKTSIENFDPRSIIIGNLPYNIATAIIEKFVSFHARKGAFRNLYFMVQREHARRLIAQPGTKEYGAFSCFIQYHANPKILFKISNGCFFPKPKVQSCFIHIDLPEKKKYTYTNEDFLFNVIHEAFGQRRKTAINALSRIFTKNILTRAFGLLQLDMRLRAENLTVQNYIDLCLILEGEKSTGKTE